MVILWLVTEAVFPWLEFQVDDYMCLNNLNDSYPSLWASVAIHHLVFSFSFYVHCG